MTTPPAIPAFKDEATAPTVSKKAAKAAAPEVKRTRIILEENDEVPPTGLFLSVNGVGYVLRPGEESDVPDFLLEVLDNAVTSTPRTNAERIVGYKDRSRFPYRIVK